MKPPRLEDFHVLQEFRDVFPDGFPRLPPKRDIDFIIELVPRATPMSKTPYRVSMPDLLELKMQLQELWEHQFGLRKRKMIHFGYVLITDS